MTFIPGLFHRLEVPFKNTQEAFHWMAADSILISSQTGGLECACQMGGNGWHTLDNGGQTR